MYSVMKMKNLKKESIILYIITFVIVLGGDLITKMLISSSMQLGQSQTFIDNFFYFTYAHNEGAAWGMLAGNVWLFVLVAIVATVIIFYYFKNSKSYQILTRFGLVLVFAGLVGNLVDRVWLGYVRDFIDFVILGYDFPVFNIADMGVVIGVVLIVIEILFEETIRERIKNSK